MSTLRIGKSNEKDNKKIKKLCKNCPGTHRLPHTSEDVFDDYLMNWENVWQGKPKQAWWDTFYEGYPQYMYDFFFSVIIQAQKWPVLNR